MKTLPLYEIIGWFGVLCVLASYGLLSAGFVAGNSVIYHGMVLAGSIGVAGVSLRKRSFQPAVLNIAFALLACFALLRLGFS